jgi:hypothetical protein
VIISVSLQNQRRHAIFKGYWPVSARYSCRRTPWAWLQQQPMGRRHAAAGGGHVVLAPGLMIVPARMSYRAADLVARAAERPPAS